MELAVKECIARPDLTIAATGKETAAAVAAIPGALGGSTQIETEHIPVKVLSFHVIKSPVDALAKGKYLHTELKQGHGHT